MVSEDGRCDTEIRKHIGIAKDTFQKLGTVFKDRRLGIKQKLEYWTVTSIRFYYMAVNAGQYQCKWKKGWRPQRCGSLGECYEFHGPTT